MGCDEGKAMSEPQVAQGLEYDNNQAVYALHRKTTEACSAGELGHASRSPPGLDNYLSLHIEDVSSGIDFEKGIS